MKKLYNINLSKKNTIALFHLLIFAIFAWRRVTIWICLHIIFERLYPPRSVRLSNNKVIFFLENEKLVKKLLVLEFLRQVKKISVLGADPSFL